MRSKQRLDRIQKQLDVNLETGKRVMLGNITTIVKRVCGAIPEDAEIVYSKKVADTIKKIASMKK